MSGPVNFKALNAVTATGAGPIQQYHSPRNIHTMQVTLGGAVNATGVIVNMEGTLSVDANGDPTGWFTMATWDLAAPLASGAVVVASEVPVTFIRANLATFTGGTTPNLSAEITSESY